MPKSSIGESSFSKLFDGRSWGEYTRFYARTLMTIPVLKELMNGFVPGSIEMFMYISA
jgi:hypothetical protein